MEGGCAITLINHGLQSGLIQFAICKSLNADIHITFWTVLFAVLLGVFPDAQRLFQEHLDDWNTYNLFHKLDENLFIPYWNLHILEDFFTHDEYGKWKSWVLPVEIVSDMVFLIVIIILL